MSAATAPNSPPSETLDPGDARTSGLAAALALGGHVVIVLLALLWHARAPETLVAPTVVGVTLVGGQAGERSASRQDRAARPRASPPAPSPAPSPDPSGERLDRLIATPTTSRPAPDASPASLADQGAGRTGSSRAAQGLGPGEGAEGVDLYATASLPDVGPRPAAAPSGDLWRRVSPCWRPAASRPATLLVSVLADGRLATTPQAVRRRGVTADPQTQLAERAAVRALQACAPYVGLREGQWRVEFP